MTTAREYMPILDNRRLDDELAEARRILRNFRAKFASGNASPVRSRHIEARDIDVRDIEAFFERWPKTDPKATPTLLEALTDLVDACNENHDGHDDSLCRVCTFTVLAERAIAKATGS